MLALVLLCLAADPPMIGRPPKPSPVLAEGPLEVVVTPWNAGAGRAGPPEDALLFRVAEGHVIYHRLNRLGETVISEPADGRNPVLGVKAKNGTQAWVWSTAQKKFTGPKVIPLAAELTAQKPADEARHLYFGYGRLADRLDAAIRAGDAPAVADLGRRAETLAEYVGRRRLDPAVGQLYAGVPAYAAGFARRKGEAADLYATAAKDEQNLRSAEAAAQRKAVAAQMAGLFTAFVGAIGTPDGYDLYKFSDGSMEAVERRAIDPAAIMTGVAGMAQAQATLMAERARLAQARKLLSAELAGRLDGLAKADRDARKARVSDHQAAGGRYGLTGRWPLDPEQLADDQAARPDPAAVAAVYQAQALFERGPAGPDNPFRVADVCGWTAATADPAGVLKAAETCAAAVGLVPPDPVHDPDRVELLARAAGLANAAAWKHVGTRYLDTAFHPYSLTARRLAEAAAGYPEVPDAGGQAREQLVYALAGCGELDKAAVTAAPLADLRAGHLAFQFQLARVQAGAGKPAEAAAHLRRALAAGLPRKTAAENADIKHAGGRGSPVAEALAVRVDAAFTPGRRLSEVAVTNTSAFPLTNVKLKLIAAGPRVPAQEVPLTAKVIRPGETLKWPVALPPGASKRILRGSTSEGEVVEKSGF